ncbi:hypothetical protein AGMMS50262_01530 [Bacteroidia bacterium]|nr:hypothetical protein AGMMS50262_01530 [Bacteroidia bacterium]
MKTKLFWFALLAILFSVNNSSLAQDYAGSKTVTSAGNVDLTDWIVPTDVVKQIYLLKIVVEQADPQLVNTGVNAWTTPYRNFPGNYPNYSSWVNAHWAPISVPGAPYSIALAGVGLVQYDVSYISDPWIGVDQAADAESPHLTSFGGTITAQNVVNLKLSSVFASYYDEIIKLENGIEVASIGLNQAVYTISESGSYRLSTRSGSSSPLENLDFEVNIGGSMTPTVTNVTVSPPSTSVEKSQTKQFTAQVTGTNTPATTVNWTVEGATASSISTSGLLSVGSGETATTLVVRATSTVDNTKSGTASVIVGSPPPVINYYTVTAHTDPPEAPAVTIYEYIDGSWNTAISDGTFEEGQYCSVKISDYSIDDWQQIGWTVNGDTINDAYGYYHTGNYSFIVTADTEIVAHFTRTTDIPDLSSAPPIARVVVYDLAGKIIIEKQGDTTAGEVSALPAGIYVKKEILGTGAVRSRKIVK